MWGLTSESKLLARVSNLPISPLLNAEIKVWIHSHSDPVSVCRIGCSSCRRSETNTLSLVRMRKGQTYQFTKVVDRLSQDRGNAQIMCPLPPVFQTEILGIIHTCQVQQCVLVVWSIIRLDLVIFRSDEVITPIDQHLH